MGHEEDSSSGLVVILLALGVLSAAGVLFAGSLFFQRKQSDPFFATDDYRTYRERLAVNEIRRSIAEEFALAVVNCLSPPIVPGQSVTEQHVSDRVTAALRKISEPQGTETEQKCQASRSSHWTFEAPCSVKISESFAKMNGGLNFGAIAICKTAIVGSLLAAARSCPPSAGFEDCLAKAIPTSSEVKYEIDKP